MLALSAVIILTANERIKRRAAEAQNRKAAPAFRRATSLVERPDRTDASGKGAWSEHLDGKPALFLQFDNVQRATVVEPEVDNRGKASVEEFLAVRAAPALSILSEQLQQVAFS
jgi:hypothetical protein